MKYPDDFDVRAFPAGRRIAISRFMAIGSLVVFALILFSCFLLIWSMRSASVKPYIIALDSRTGNWNTITLENVKQGAFSISKEYAIQQSLIGRFTLHWFAITQSPSMNSGRWRECNRERDCVPGSNSVIYGTGECVIYCNSGDALYKTFVSTVLPDYNVRVASHDAWRVVPSTVKVRPLSDIGTQGGAWQVYATVRSAIAGDMQIVAYVKVAHSTEHHKQTSGFYVSEFNAYKIN